MCNFNVKDFSSFQPLCKANYPRDKVRLIRVNENILIQQLHVQRFGQFLIAKGRMRVPGLLPNSLVKEKLRIAALVQKSVRTIAGRDLE